MLSYSSSPATDACYLVFYPFCAGPERRLAACKSLGIHKQAALDQALDG